MVGVCTVQFKFRLQGHTVGQPALKTLFNRVTRWVDIIIEKFENEVVASVGNREVFCKNFEKAFVVSFFGRGVELKKISE